MDCIKPPHVYVADTGTTKGRGVFAGRDFAEGETVEVAPVLVLPEGQAQLPAVLKQRTFGWGVLTGLEDGSEAIPSGYACMYNHASPANMAYHGDLESMVMRFTAARKIKRGEELTINYNTRGSGPVCEDDNWFERHDVTPI